MDALTYDLLRIARRSGEGSYATQANRKAMLKQMAATLKEGGFKLPGASSIKPKHIEFLLERWREAEVSDRTILNRLAVLRWWVEAVDKKSIMARDNEAYGVSKAPVEGKARAQDLAPEQLQFITCPRIPASATKRFNADATNVLKAKQAQAETDLGTWFDGNARIALDEEVIGLGSYGFTLTILSSETLPDDPDQEEDEEAELAERWTPRFAYKR